MLVTSLPLYIAIPILPRDAHKFIRQENKSRVCILFCALPRFYNKARARMKILILILLICFFAFPSAFSELQVGFYSSTCPQAESIVQKVVQKRFNRDQSITAALLRMHFHDCFVSGCDASILIDSTPSNPSEKATGPNASVRGYDLIDEIKESVEATCPSKVSCADIITLATRDAVALAGGPKYDVPTGRRDGLVSNPQQVDLPGPSIPVSSALQFFAQKGFSPAEMVTLLGAHTVGIAHCGFFSGRLSGNDPNMDPSLHDKLVKLCSKPEASAFLDQNTSFTVDNEFYKQILNRKGILQIDQQLALDKSTGGIVSDFALNGNRFRQSFANAIVKMSKLQVLEGKAGEIRKNCRAFNTAN